MKHRTWRKSGFQSTSLIAGALLLLVVFVSVAYFFLLADSGPSPRQQEMLAQLQERRDEWVSKRPPAFRYEIERECDCPLSYVEPFTVVEYLDDPDNQAWIDQYFERLAAAILGGSDVAIGYDPRFSFPNDFHIAEEQTYIRDFEVLEYE
jgi:hypothetical protein